MDIYQIGCVPQARNFVNSNLYIILGTGGGLLVFEFIGLFLSITLAVMIKKERDLARTLTRQNRYLKD